MKSRRSTLVFLGVAAGIVGSFQAFPWLLDRFSGMPEFEPIENPDGFRRISSGASSSGSFDPFLGLGDKDAKADAVIDAQVRANLCGSLFGDAKDPSETVPIACFSDYYCPYCRVQMRRLAELAEEPGSDISVVWHELPLLGNASDLAAKAALAAKRQGADVDFNEALLTSGFRATPCRAASRWLMPSAQASRTFRYRSTVKILPPSLSPERVKVDDFYTARSRLIPPLPWPTFAPPFSA